MNKYQQIYQLICEVFATIRQFSGSSRTNGKKYLRGVKKPAIVLIIAASARGLAQSIERCINRSKAQSVVHSVVRSGPADVGHPPSIGDCDPSNMEFVAADLFNDADTQRTFKTVPVRNYPGEFVRVTETIRPDYVIYSGGLENHDDVIETIEHSAIILGNGSSVLRNLNDKERLFKSFTEEVANETGVAIPRFYFIDSDPQKPPGDPRELILDVTWLRKKLKSCGGLNIETFTDRSEFATLRTSSKECYFQERIAGASYSAIFVAAKDSAGKSKSNWLANTIQLTGDQRFNASGFVYTGSILSNQLTPEQNKTIILTGEWIAERYGLVGVFNIDFVVSDDKVFFIEINPRYSASMELLDRATGNSIFDLHLSACLGKDIQVGDYRNVSEMKRYGKAVWYSDREIVVSRRFFEYVKNRNELSTRENGFPVIADIPMPKTKIERGQPVFTVFADDRSETGVDEKLLETATIFASSIQ